MIPPQATIIGPTTGSDGYYDAVTSSGSTVSAVSILRTTMTAGQTVTVIQCGDEYGVIALDKGLRGALALPSDARSTAEADGPASVALSSIGRWSSLVQRVYVLGQVVSVGAASLVVDLSDGPYQGRRITTTVDTLLGISVSDFEAEEKVVLRSWPDAVPVVIGWWESEGNVPIVQITAPINLATLRFSTTTETARQWLRATVSGEGQTFPTPGTWKIKNISGTYTKTLGTGNNLQVYLHEMPQAPDTNYVLSYEITNGDGVTGTGTIRIEMLPLLLISISIVSPVGVQYTGSLVTYEADTTYTTPAGWPTQPQPDADYAVWTLYETYGPPPSDPVTIGYTNPLSHDTTAWTPKPQTIAGSVQIIGVDEEETTVSDAGTATFDVDIDYAYPTVTSATADASGSDIILATFTITGTGFRSGATVALAKDGEDDIELAVVSLSGSTELTCTGRLVGAAVGDWDVVVTNPDAKTGTGEGAFTVTAPVLTVVSVTDEQESYTVGTLGIMLTRKGDESLRFTLTPSGGGSSSVGTIEESSGDTFIVSFDVWYGTYDLVVLESLDYGDWYREAHYDGIVIAEL